jgi:hypothetical protein
MIKRLIIAVFLLFSLNNISFADAYLESSYYTVAAEFQPDGFYISIDGNANVDSPADGETNKRLSYNLTTSGVTEDVLHTIRIEPYNATYAGTPVMGSFTYNSSGGTVTFKRSRYRVR